MYETTGIVDERMLRQIKKFMMKKRQKVIYGAAIIFCLWMIFSTIVDKEYSKTVVYVAALLLVLTAIWFVVEKGIRTTLNRWVELGGRPEAMYTTCFLPKGIYMKNHVTGAEGIIEYIEIADFYVAKDAMFIFTKSGSFLVSFKGEKHSFQDIVNYLKIVKTSIKW